MNKRAWQRNHSFNIGDKVSLCENEGDEILEILRIQGDTIVCRIVGLPPPRVQYEGYVNELEADASELVLAASCQAVAA